MDILKDTPETAPSASKTLSARRPHFYALLMAIYSALLLWLSWPPISAPLLIFAAITPLLYLEKHIRTHFKASYKWLLIYGYLSMVLWNVLTTYWIYYASPEGAYLAIGLNSLLQTIPLLVYHRAAKRLSRRQSYIVLAGAWMSIELLHLNWDAPWPWLNLGNAFASVPGWVQWYEYTGTFGGSLWVLLVNIALFEMLAGGRRAITLAALLRWMAFILLPLLVSYLVGRIAEEEMDKAKAGQAPTHVAVIQPNIDPFNTKFNEDSFARQADILIELTRRASDSATDLIIWPETAIPSNSIMVVGAYSQAQFMGDFVGMMKEYPRARLLAGASPWRRYEAYEKHSATARKLDDGLYYDLYNAALWIDSSGVENLYAKSKLVPGVEKMPYPALFGFLEDFAIAIGGSSGSLGSQDTPSVFQMKNGRSIAPVICYESIFGQHVSRFFAKNAGLLCIITNDGWWRDTEGYRQHMAYARLRAIEERTYVARAANTGISAIITPLGAVSQHLDWDKRGYLKAEVWPAYKTTLYARFGDVIGKIMAISALILLLLSFRKRRISTE